jgi:hypothetical protein
VNHRTTHNFDDLSEEWTVTLTLTLIVSKGISVEVHATRNSGDFGAKRAAPSVQIVHLPIKSEILWRLTHGLIELLGRIRECFSNAAPTKIDFASNLEVSPATISDRRSSKTLGAKRPRLCCILRQAMFFKAAGPA